MMGLVAERQGLSRKYLHALLTSLKSAGLVTSVRGAGGGFMLSRAPEEISLSEIMHALEGPLALVRCVAEAGACERSSDCAARRVWDELSGAIEGVLNGVTLADMVASESPHCSKPVEVCKPPTLRRRRKAPKMTDALSRGRRKGAEKT